MEEDKGSWCIDIDMLNDEQKHSVILYLNTQYPNGALLTKKHIDSWRYFGVNSKSNNINYSIKNPFASPISFEQFKSLLIADLEN